MTTDEGTTQYQYNAINQLLSAGDLSLDYDANGNVTSRSTEEGTAYYSYDGLNRLANIDFEDGSYASYAYDGLGRKVFREEMSWKDYEGIKKGEDGEKGKGKGNNGNAYGKNKDDNKGQQKKEENASNGNGKGKNNKLADCTTTDSHPGNGNGNNKGSNKGKGNGPLNNPGKGNKFGLYKKLGENPELKEQMDVTETAYLYQGFSTNVHKEYSASGSPYAEYYMGANNQTVSRKMFGNHGLSNPSHDPNLKTTGGMLYYQYDGLNTVSSVTDRHGDIIENYRYDVFGGIQTGITAPYNHNAYTSQRYDDKAGLIDMNARWYDPTVGRFLTQDTYRGDGMNPLTQNRYSYVLNNPVNMWDPTGHIPESIIHDGLSGVDGKSLSGIPDWMMNKHSYDEKTGNSPSSYTHKFWTYQDYNRVYKSDIRYNIVEADDHRSITINYEADVKDTWYYLYTEKLVERIDDEALLVTDIFENVPVQFHREGTIKWPKSISAKSLAGEIESFIAENYKPPKNEIFNELSAWAEAPDSAIFLTENELFMRWIDGDRYAGHYSYEWSIQAQNIQKHIVPSDRYENRYKVLGHGFKGQVPSAENSFIIKETYELFVEDFIVALNPNSTPDEQLEAQISIVAKPYKVGKKVLFGIADIVIDLWGDDEDTKYVDKVSGEFPLELLKTEENTAFFWSGKTDGIGGAERALEIANQKGGTTLEGVIESKGINIPDWDINNPASIKAWENVSAAYANQVIGEVRAVVGSNLRQDNIWKNVELPRLMKNSNVTKITTIDPKTRVEKVIFER